VATETFRTWARCRLSVSLQAFRLYLEWVWPHSLIVTCCSWDCWTRACTNGRGGLKLDTHLKYHPKFVIPSKKSKAILSKNWCGLGSVFRRYVCSVRGVPSGRPAASIVRDGGALRTLMDIQAFLLHKGGPGEARYGLDGTGIKSWLGRDFPQSSKPGLGPTRSFVQWAPCLSRG
jgi:hypothetical protein